MKWPALVLFFFVLHGRVSAHEVGLGQAVDFTLMWSTNAESKVLDMCVNATHPTITPRSWIGFGFNAGAMDMMNATDIVAGWMDTEMMGNVVSLYSLTPASGPSGEATLGVHAASVTITNTTISMCFSRDYESGHKPITDNARCIWAIGQQDPDEDGLTYHGSDGHDDSGNTQIHRSDETPVIDWLTGPEAPTPPPVGCDDFKTVSSCADDASCVATTACVPVDLPTVTNCVEHMNATDCNGDNVNECIWAGFICGTRCTVQHVSDDEGCSADPKCQVALEGCTSVADADCVRSLGRSCDQCQRKDTCGWMNICQPLTSSIIECESRGDEACESTQECTLYNGTAGVLCIPTANCNAMDPNACNAIDGCGWQGRCGDGFEQSPCIAPTPAPTPAPSSSIFGLGKGTDGFVIAGLCVLCLILGYGFMKFRRKPEEAEAALLANA